MKLISFVLLLIPSIIIAQNQYDVKAYLSYEEFLNNAPSETIEYRLEERTSKDIFMMGGITNHKFGKIKAKELKVKLNNKIWGVMQDGKNYINSYLYSEKKGFNEILGTGFYTYFIGEPAYKKEPQIKLGFIKQDDPLKQVCCKTGYVMYKSGEVKLLTPELLIELLAGDKKIQESAKKANLKQENILEMFEFLAAFNQSNN